MAQIAHILDARTTERRKVTVILCSLSPDIRSALAAVRVEPAPARDEHQDQLAALAAVRVEPAPP